MSKHFKSPFSLTVVSELRKKSVMPELQTNFDQHENQHLAIAWSGLPPYAAYCLAELARVYPGKLTILGTQADVPHQGIEEKIGREVHWLSRNESYTWAQLGLPRPDHFIHTGWAYPAFNSLGAQVRRAGGKRYSMIDTIWYGTLRQWIGLLYFRLVYRRWFDAVLVPGRAGRRFCRRMGMPDARIFEGLYGANPEIFSPGPPLAERPKRMLFVGRLIERKSVPTLLEAIRRSRALEEGWEFVFIGAGPLEEAVRAIKGVRLEPFSSPEVIAEWMRGSRYLLLPSVEENWGVVVHEAALSGCGLVLTEGIGAGEDLLSEANGRKVAKSSVDSLQEMIDSLLLLSEAEQEQVFIESLTLAANFGPQAFVSSVERMLG